MDDSTALAEIEAIKRLKARYCRYLDTKEWALWRTIFADGFRADTTDGGGKVIVGGDEFVAFTRRNVGKLSQPTAHQVHAPEIELTSPTTAQGVWALQDVVRLAPGVDLVGYGHYHETYEKSDGRWQIKTLKLTRLREDIATPVITVRIPGRLKKAAARAAVRRSGQHQQDETDEIMDSQARCLGHARSGGAREEPPPGGKTVTSDIRGAGMSVAVPTDDSR